MLRLGPNQFNYEQVFKLALMKSKYFEVSLCIMNGILEMPKLHNCIPRDEVWW